MIFRSWQNYVDRVYITYNFISPVKEKAFRDTCLACFFHIKTQSYLYFDTASMSIMIYFYPSKPYKHVTGRMYRVIHTSYNIYADDYILFEFGSKHRVMNRSYINNVFVNIGVFSQIKVFLEFGDTVVVQYYLWFGRKHHIK